MGDERAHLVREDVKKESAESNLNLIDRSWKTKLEKKNHYAKTKMTKDQRDHTYPNYLSELFFPGSSSLLLPTCDFFVGRILLDTLFT